ncbi:TIGR01212 family radical SAM protein [Aestuariirhabdus litorea]|uniref:TIGR01212 family radical SAM protein n=1 Tax=Aestuariirhabdus litorea TaxID=2528527 RepID=A0A3P3VM99_9GAMM|nr:TIGR01212 family radical SAM protein [Aestuariirhabdus litorea]RRJ83554.1 TIGR01212 family radical SAM protein [Aestuariirhabdus litorea]RWW96775.1 TIGR01212 family radical SAM protein [Endozoicomonadaceae bacterium GTF-13]
MDLTRYVTTFGQAMQRKYGEKVYKLSVNAAFNCPNRDGSRGIGGCAFCNVNSFSPQTTRYDSVREQIEQGRRRMSQMTGARKFIAYFQAYSNTYGELERLKQLYDEALACDQVIGLAVGTRPDCVPDPVLDLLASYQRQGKEVWLELGLQSARDDTLAAVNRGHGFAEYRDAVQRVRARGLQLCTHLIIGLPGERGSDALDSFARVIELGVDAIKVHPLHIVKGTQLARQWKRGEIEELSLDEYCETVAEIIRRAPPGLIFHRLHGSGSPDYLLAPQWCRSKWGVLGEIHQRLTQKPGEHYLSQ